MYFKQSDLFWQLSHDFVKKIMAQAMKKNYPSGACVFREGDPAREFFILIKGHIRLKIGDSGQVVHTVSHAGEFFGWSALLAREYYSAQAECMAACELLVFQAQRIQRIVETDPTNGLFFMKRLAGIIGERLIQNYRLTSAMPRQDTLSSFGTRQLAELAGDSF